MDSLKFAIYYIILIYPWFLSEKSYVTWKYLQFFSLETFNKNLKTWLKVYINNIGYEIVYTYNIIYVCLWMSRFEVESEIVPGGTEEGARRKNVRSVRRANRYAFRINICSIHDGTLLWMHPSSHSHMYINKHILSLVSPVPHSSLSFSLLGFLPLLHDTTAVFTFHCDLPANPERSLWILQTELTERLAVIFIHDGVIDFAAIFIAVKNKMFCENKKHIVEAFSIMFKEAFICNLSFSSNFSI